VNEDPMNQVALGRRMLRLYVIKTTEVKENVAKLKRSYLPGNTLRSS